MWSLHFMRIQFQNHLSQQTSHMIEAYQDCEITAHHLDIGVYTCVFIIKDVWHNGLHNTNTYIPCGEYQHI